MGFYLPIYHSAVGCDSTVAYFKLIFSSLLFKKVAISYRNFEKDKSAVKGSFWQHKKAARIDGLTLISLHWWFGLHIKINFHKSLHKELFFSAIIVSNLCIWRWIWTSNFVTLWYFKSSLKCTLIQNGIKMFKN